MSYTILDNSTISSKNFYELIDNYFESPILEKIQDQNNTSIYMCKIKTLLASPEQMYLVAITSLDKNQVGLKLPLSNINWKSFQTRAFSKFEKNIVTHKYSPKNMSEYTIPVSLVERYEDHTDYSIENYRATVTLLHKNKNIYEYPSSGNLASCLETYKTVIVI